MVPVKRLELAKSRLRPDVVDASALALAFAEDTVRAAIACPSVAEVVVVTGDERVSAAMAALGARTVADPGGGINAAVSAGITAARQHGGDDQPGAAVLTGDLPALTAHHLDHALGLASLVDLGIVPDHGGSGTTMITAAAGLDLVPHYGEGSRVLHERAGHAVLAVDEQSPLRWDVDTAPDLATALTLGVGPATALVVSRWAIPR